MTTKSLTTILDEVENRELRAIDKATSNKQKDIAPFVMDLMNQESREVLKLIAVIRRMEEGLRQYAEPLGNQWVNGVRQSVFFGDYHAKARETLAESEKILQSETSDSVLRGEK